MSAGWLSQLLMHHTPDLRASSQDFWGYTPLHLLVACTAAAFAKEAPPAALGPRLVQALVCLLRAGARLDVTNVRGERPAHVAAPFVQDALAQAQAVVAGALALQCSDASALSRAGSVPAGADSMAQFATMMAADSEVVGSAGNGAQEVPGSAAAANGVSALLTGPDADGVIGNTQSEVEPNAANEAEDPDQPAHGSGELAVSSLEPDAEASAAAGADAVATGMFVHNAARTADDGSGDDHWSEHAVAAGARSDRTTALPEDGGAMCNDALGSADAADREAAAVQHEPDDFAGSTGSGAAEAAGAEE